MSRRVCSRPCGEARAHLAAGKGVKEEQRWERKGCWTVKEADLSSDLSADPTLIIAALRVGGEGSELEYR